MHPNGRSLFRSFLLRPSLVVALLSPVGLAADSAVPEDRIVVLSRGTDAEIRDVERPRYPRVAAMRGLESWVRVRFDVDEKGRPENLEVYESGGDTPDHRSFEKAALRALKDWRFEPATLEGKPVPRENFVQFISFQLDNGSGAMTRPFRARFVQASAAVDDGNLEAMREAIDALQALDLRLMSEHAYLSMLEAVYWEAAGDDERALEFADRARLLFNEQAVPEAFHHVLRMGVVLHGAVNDFHTALDRYEELQEEPGGLPDEDPLHAVARRIREALQGDDAIVTEDTIAPCALCRDRASQLTRRLNRQRFMVEVLSGQVDSLRISCAPAYVTVEWAADVAWRIEQPPEDCRITLDGSDGAQVRLIELAVES